MPLLSIRCLHTVEENHFLKSHSSDTSHICPVKGTLSPREAGKYVEVDRDFDNEYAQFCYCSRRLKGSTFLSMNNGMKSVITRDRNNTFTGPLESN